MHNTYHYQTKLKFRSIISSKWTEHLFKNAMFAVSVGLSRSQSHTHIYAHRPAWIVQGHNTIHYIPILDYSKSCNVIQVSYPISQQGSFQGHKAIYTYLILRSSMDCSRPFNDIQVTCPHIQHEVFMVTMPCIHLILKTNMDCTRSCNIMHANLAVSRKCSRSYIIHVCYPCSKGCFKVTQVSNTQSA